MFKYHQDDAIYDIESLDNIFTLAMYYPKIDRLDIYYIDDDNNLNDNEIKAQAETKIRETVRACVNSQINFYDLTNNHPHQIANLYRLAQTLGIATSPNQPNNWIENTDQNNIVRPNWLQAIRYNKTTGKIELATDQKQRPLYIAPDDPRQLNEWYQKIVPHMQKYVQYENNSSIKDQKPKIAESFSDSNINAHFDAYQDQIIYPGFIPVNKTDIGRYNPEKQGHGLRLGYNSHNYDETLLAGLIALVKWNNLETIISYNIYHLKHKLNEIKLFDENYPDSISHDLAPSAHDLREINNAMFQADNMNSFWLKKDKSPSDYQLGTVGFNKVNHYAQGIKNAWKFTNRYLDVAALNEHQKHISLKRLSGLLGLKIKESDKLSDNTDTITKDTVSDLLAYNNNDVINTQKLFENAEYQKTYNLRNDLFKLYPQIQYDITDTNLNDQEIQSPNNIDRYRINNDSSSAQTIAKIIKPNGTLEDSPTVDYTFPSQQIFNQLKNDVDGKHGDHYDNLHNHKDQTVYYHEDGSTTPLVDETKPYNVLEQTRNWYKHEIIRYYHEAVKEDQNGNLPDGLTLDTIKANWKEAWKQFDIIYRFYKEVEQTNLNATIGNKGQDPIHYAMKVNNKAKKLMIKYNKMSHNGLNLIYRDRYGQNTSCFVCFSVGGIHGQEIHMNKYNQDMKVYQKEYEEYQQYQKDYERLIKIYDQVADLNAEDQTSIIEQYRESNKYKDLDLDLIFTKRNKLRKHKPSAKKEPKKPVIFKEPTPSKRDSQLTRLNKDYTYTSTGRAFHEDFSSYYPLLLTRLAVFMDQITGTDVYNQLYLERLKFKSKLNDYEFNSPEYNDANRQQLIRKLLLNSASGAGDAKFFSPIRVNNKVNSMRIIGQLFAWRIGQAESFAGARVISTNTDGLYTMPNEKYPEFDEEMNAKVLEETVKPMLVDIEPETVTYFVSKDANNRLEEYDGVIKSAKGQTLNSANGPSVSNNLSHPALNDAVLEQYLDIKGSCDRPYDYQYVQNQLQNHFNEINHDTDKLHDTLKFTQWIIQANPSKLRYHILTSNGQCHPLSKTNRIFLVKSPNPNNQIQSGQLEMVTITKAKKKSAFQTELLDMSPNEMDENQRESYEALKMIAEIKGQNLQKTFEDINGLGKEPVFQKVSGLPDDQYIEIRNESWDETIEMIQNGDDLIDRLDLNAYNKMIQSSFEQSWLN